MEQCLFIRTEGRGIEPLREYSRRPDSNRKPLPLGQPSFMGHLGIEPNRRAFQTRMRTSYTNDPCRSLGTFTPLRLAACLPVL